MEQGTKHRVKNPVYVIHIMRAWNVFDYNSYGWGNNSQNHRATIIYNLIYLKPRQRRERKVKEIFSEQLRDFVDEFDVK